MPIYEYSCEDCGKEYEELVSIQTKQDPPCPSCGSNAVNRKISLFGSLGLGSGSCGNSGFT